MHINRMIQHFPQSLNDCEAEPEATRPRASFSLIIFIKYTRKLIAHDPDAAVPDLNAGLVTGAAAAQQDLAVVGIADCI